jgi:hypothetical protein
VRRFNAFVYFYTGTRRSPGPRDRTSRIARHNDVVLYGSERQTSPTALTLLPAYQSGLRQPPTPTVHPRNLTVLLEATVGLRDSPPEAEDLVAEGVHTIVDLFIPGSVNDASVSAICKALGRIHPDGVHF